MIDAILDDVRLKYIDRPDRFNHILGVAKLSVSLAVRYGVDSKKAYIAAIYHDYTKYDSIEEQTKYLSDEMILKYKDQTVIYHALSAAEVLRIKHHIEDPLILNAIQCHVWGKENMTLLDKILLVADKTEETRTYEGVDDLRVLSQTSLNQTIVAYLKLLKVLDKEQNYPENNYLDIVIKDLEGKK